MSIEPMILALEKALDRYLNSSPDHFAMLEVRKLRNKLRSDPETTVQEISSLFNGPKTLVTDTLYSQKTREAASGVEDARKPLGNHFAKQRRQLREKVNKAKQAGTP